MNPQIAVIAKKVNEIVREGSQVLAGAGTPTGMVDVSRKYHGWYASCLGLVEANMPSRLAELVSKHSAVQLSDFSIQALTGSSNATARLAAQKLRENIAQI